MSAPDEQTPGAPTPGRVLSPTPPDEAESAPMEDLPRRVTLIFRQALVASVVLVPVDLAYRFWVHPHANLPTVILVRVITAAMYAGYVGLAPPATERAALRAMAVTGGTVVALNALLTHLTGGLLSLYVLVLTLLGTAAAGMARPRREALTLQLGVWAFYGITFAALLPLFPETIAQLDQPSAVGTFAFLYGFCLATPFLSAEISHLLWSLRREIFESKRVGRYVLRRRIGRGGMGEVWSAWHVGLKREVAVKFLHAQMHDSVSRRRFTREARATAVLQHPHTVRILDAGVADDGQPYYAMELLEGASLRQLVDRQGPLSPGRALRLIEQAARALGEAHERGIVHRDIKPENLFVCTAGSDETVKVLDFGIARMADGEEGEKLTRTGWIAGTPAYIAPEVVQGGEAGPAADVYALGATLHFALTGAPPFAYEMSAAVLFAHLHEPPPALVGPAPTAADTALEAAVHRALAKDPAARFADGTAMAVALAAVPQAQTFHIGPGRAAGTPRPSSAESEAPTRELEASDAPPEA